MSLPPGAIEHLSQRIPALGIALLLSLVVGKVCQKLHVPKVTGYILIGILLGPSAANLLSHEMAETFDFINQIAFGLILFNIGGEFHRELFEKMAFKHVKNAITLCLAIFLISSLLLFVISALTPLDLVGRIAVSLFLGIVAIEAAPPTTLLVVKEFDAKGPLTHSIMVFLVIATIFAIIGSEAIKIAYFTLDIWKFKELSLGSHIVRMIWSIAGAFIVGTLFGFLLSFWEQREKSQGELFFAVICTIMFGQTISYYLSINSLLVSLVLGFTVVNASQVGIEIHKGIKNMGLSIYAIFFVLAGAHIDIKNQISTLGIMGTGYILARTLAIYLGSKISTQYVAEVDEVKKYLGTSLLSHAGVALAIVLAIKDINEPSAQTIVSVVMGSIFIFEIIGPMLLRKSLKHAGEMTMAKKSSATSKGKISLDHMIRNFYENLGLSKISSLSDVNTVKNSIKTDVVAIRGSASFEELTQFVKKYQFSIYPVVDEEHKYEGVISFEALQNALMDKDHSRLLIAKNLIGTRLFIPEDAHLFEAVDLFNQYNVDILPVVNRESRRLVGILNYKDLLISMNAGHSPKVSPT